MRNPTRSNQAECRAVALAHGRRIPPANEDKGAHVVGGPWGVCALTVAPKMRHMDLNWITSCMCVAQHQLNCRRRFSSPWLFGRRRRCAQTRSPATLWRHRFGRAGRVHSGVDLGWRMKQGLCALLFSISAPRHFDGRVTHMGNETQTLKHP